MKTYNHPAIGCYLEQANRNPSDHNEATVRLAISLGYIPSNDDLAVIDTESDADFSEHSSGMDRSELLNEIADEAINWLNSQEDRSFLSWSNNGEAGAFGLWPDIDSAKEECGYVGEDTPADDFRGEWLQVNCHGNVTLYIREDHADLAFWDTEIWAIV